MDDEQHIELNEAMQLESNMTPLRKTRIQRMLRVLWAHVDENFTRNDLMHWCGYRARDRWKFEVDLSFVRNHVLKFGWCLSWCSRVKAKDGSGRIVMTFSRNQPSETTHHGLISGGLRSATGLFHIKGYSEWELKNGVTGNDRLEAQFLFTASSAGAEQMAQFLEVVQQRRRDEAEIKRLKEELAKREHDTGTSTE